MTITEVAIPIFVSTEKNGETVVLAIQGTAFSIGNGFFLTAKHVILEVMPLGERKISLGFEQGGSGTYELCSINSWDTDDRSKLDVCVLSVGKDFPPLKWKSDRLFNLTPVAALGYPYGFSAKHKKVYHRSFSGHIVSSGSHEDEGILRYELSFSCPRGISGAPILTPDYASICGLIIGNTLLEIDLGSQTEITEKVNEDGTKTLTKEVFTKMETTTFGIAYHVSELLAITFESLGNITLGEYLKSKSLFV